MSIFPQSALVNSLRVPYSVYVFLCRSVLIARQAYFNQVSHYGTVRNTTHSVAFADNQARPIIKQVQGVGDTMSVTFHAGMLSIGVEKLPYSAIRELTTEP